MAADRHLLFGLLALQNGLIDQGQLVAAFQPWTRDKSRPLAEHLAARVDLDADRRSAVVALVALHIKKQGGSAEKSPGASPVSVRHAGSGHPDRPDLRRRPEADRRPCDCCAAEEK
jgi:hypothetical protein